MPQDHQASHPTDDPDGDNPELVYRAYLTADTRLAIRAATTEQMRRILADIARHLCHQLTDPLGGVPPLGPDQRQPWQVCQVGTGTRAGFQLYHHVLQAVAGCYLHALGFDPARATADDTYYATAIDPFLRKARKQWLRRTLNRLADHLDATVHDSDVAADVSAQADLPHDIWEVGTGVTSAIQLYRHAVRIVSVHTLFFLWEGSGVAGQTHVLRPFADADFLATHPN